MLNALTSLRIPRMLLLAMIVAAVLRLGLVAIVANHPERYASFDGAGYDQLAQNLVEHGEFSQATEAPFVPDNYRTPLYPAYIALHYWVFGHQPVSVLISQALALELVSCALVFLIGSRLFSRWVGLAAAMLFALSPISIDYSALLWSDTLFTTCLLLAVWRVLEYFHTRRRRDLLASGVLLGVATLVHPRSIVLPLAFVPFIVIQLRGWHPVIRRRTRTLVVDSALIMVAFVMVIMPWMVRNYVTFGAVNIASVADFNLLFYNVAAMEAERSGIGLSAEAANLRQEVAATSNAAPGNEAQQAAQFREVALQKLLAHPIDYLATHFKGVWPVLAPGGRLSQTLFGVASDVPRDAFEVIRSGSVDPVSKVLSVVASHSLQESGPVAADAVFLTFIYGLAIWGIWSLRRGPWGWVLLIVVLYLVLIPGPAGAPRYRVPAMPYMVLLAAVGMQAIAGLARDARRASRTRPEQPAMSGGHLTTIPR